MHITHISAQNDTNTGVLKVTEIAIGDTKNIKTDYLVGNLENFPELMKPTKPSDQRISRCVVITDRPIKTGEEISMSVVPPNTFGNSHCVYVLQLDEHVSVVPSGKYLLQFWTLGSGKGAQPDLQPIVDSFACIPTKTSESSPDTVDDRNTEPNENIMPNILYCSFWSHVERKVREDIVIPSNMLLLCGVNAEVGADSFFEKARQLFEQICPGEEFLPAMPNSLDIVLVRSNL